MINIIDKPIFLIIFLSVNLSYGVMPLFDVAMNIKSSINVLASRDHEKYFGISGSEVYTFFRTLYDRIAHKADSPMTRLKIPKIIHQIWIGEFVPEKFKAFQESWKRYHPDWEYRLWTQHDIALNNWYNADLIARSRNPGETSDIMRYEILYRYGGVYLDMDFECLAPLDVLHYTYDLYVGIQPLDSGLVQLGIGLIGSMPGHPLLWQAISRVHSSYNNPDYVGNAPARTGPLYFTNIFLTHAGKTTSDIALPAIYCYPLPCQGAELLYDEWRTLGAFGVHHWAKSWLRPHFRKIEFRDLEKE